MYKETEDNSDYYLHIAVTEENIPVIKFLLKHQFDVNAKVSIDHVAVEFPLDLDFNNREEKDDKNHSVVSRSSLSSSCPSMKKVAIKTTTALHIASRYSDTTIAKLLLSNGALVDQTMEGGETPLLIAVLSRNVEMVKLLLSYNANPNLRTNSGRTVLHYVGLTGQKQMANLLLSHDAKVNVSDYQGVTPLHLAVEAGYLEVVEVFLKSNADATLRTKTGITAIHVAAVMRHREIMEMILKNGADVNLIMKNGEVDLNAFDWINDDEKKLTWEFVSKYTGQMNLFNWYNTMLTKLYLLSTDETENKAISQVDDMF